MAFPARQVIQESIDKGLDSKAKTIAGITAYIVKRAIEELKKGVVNTNELEAEATREFDELEKKHAELAPHLQELQQLVAAFNSLIERGYGFLDPNVKDEVLEALIAANKISHNSEEGEIKAVTVFEIIRHEATKETNLMKSIVTQALAEAGIRIIDGLAPEALALLPTIRFADLFGAQSTVDLELTINVEEEPEPIENVAERQNTKIEGVHYVSARAISEALDLAAHTVVRWFSSNPALVEQLVELGMVVNVDAGGRNRYWLPTTNDILEVLWAYNQRGIGDFKRNNPVMQDFNQFIANLGLGEAEAIYNEELEEVQADIHGVAVDLGLDESLASELTGTANPDTILNAVDAAMTAFEHNPAAFTNQLSNAIVRGEIGREARLNTRGIFEAGTMLAGLEMLVEVVPGLADLSFANSTESIMSKVLGGMTSAERHQKGEEQALATAHENMRVYLNDLCQRLRQFGKDVPFAVAVNLALTANTMRINRDQARALLSIMPYVFRDRVDYVCRTYLTLNRETTPALSEQPSHTYEEIKPVQEIEEEVEAELDAEVDIFDGLTQESATLFMHIMRQVIGSTTADKGMSTKTETTYVNLNDFQAALKQAIDAIVAAGIDKEDLMADMIEALDKAGYTFTHKHSIFDIDAVIAAVEKSVPDNGVEYKLPENGKEQDSIYQLLSIISQLKLRAERMTRHSSLGNNIFSEEEWESLSASVDAKFMLGYMLVLIHNVCSFDPAIGLNMIVSIEKSISSYLKIKFPANGNGKRTTNVDRVLEDRNKILESAALEAIGSCARFLIGKHWYRLEATNLAEAAQLLEAALKGNKVEQHADNAALFLLAVAASQGRRYYSGPRDIQGGLIGNMWDALAAKLGLTVVSSSRHGQRFEYAIFMPRTRGLHRALVVVDDDRRMMAIKYFPSAEAGAVSVPSLPQNDILDVDVLRYEA